MRFSLPRLRMPRLPGFGILVWLFTALKGWVMASRDKDSDSLIMYDRTLFWLTLGLAAIGFIMVTSASMPVGQRLANDPFLFAKRDGLYIILAFCLALVTLRLPMEFWQRHSTAMLIASIIMTKKRQVMFTLVRGFVAILIALLVATLLIFISAKGEGFSAKMAATGKALQQMLIGPLFRTGRGGAVFELKRLTDIFASMIPIIFTGLSVCIMALLHPEIFTMRPLAVEIETTGEYCRGATVGDVYGVTGRAPNATCLLGVDRAAFADYLVEAMKFYGEDKA